MGRSLAMWNHTHISNFLFFNQQSFQISPDAQILPLYLNSYYGGISQQVYLLVADNGDSNYGFRNSIGGPIATRFLLAFGITNKQVGIAYTRNTFAISNSIMTTT